MGPERADNCFSLHTQDRTIDFEVDNPWLVLLVVRALRLFLGAHYDTLPAPTFFSHLCVRPRGTPSNRVDSPKQTMVWTSVDKPLLPGSKEQTTTRSTPTERTYEDSASDESDSRGGGGGGGHRGKSPWDGQDGGAGDSDSGSTMHVGGSGVPYPPPPDATAPGAGKAAGAPPLPSAEFVEDVYEEDDEETHGDRSPGGVMALFSSDGRRGIEEMSIGGTGTIGTSGPEGLAPSAEASAGEAAAAAGAAAPGGGGGGGGAQEAPLTASQVLATRGMTKRLNLSKKLANNNTGPLKGKRFDLMALPMDPGQQDRRERGASEHAETATSEFFFALFT